MMHYIMQQLDGSLAACDKTHHIRVYSNLNQGHTTLSFAYYPQFWLAAPERPVFDKTLYQLLLKQVYGLQVPVVLYGCATWSLAARREHKLRVFENRVLEQDIWVWEGRGEWRKLRNEELNDLYSSSNIIRVIKLRRMKWAGHVARVVERRGLYNGVVGKREGKKKTIWKTQA
jgi:hypothetical protein